MTMDVRIPAWYTAKSRRDFLAHYRQEHSRLLLFVGSGLSKGAGFPSWEELLRRIPRDCDPAIGIKVDREFEDLLEAREYAEAGSWLLRRFQEKGRRYKQAWRGVLDSIFMPETNESIVSPVHELLARLTWDTIITTNYDALIENALRKAGLDFEVVHPFSSDFQRSTTTTKPLVVKLHGDIAVPASDIVLTDEEYKRLYRADDSFGLKFRETLEVHLRSASLILFLGYSHDDHYLRSLINELNFPREALPPAFALARLPGEQGRSQFQTKAEELYSETGITVIPYSNEDLHHREVHDFLEYLLDQEAYEREYGVVQSMRQPTVILLYTGGTISATEGEPESGALGLPMIRSRFAPELAQRAKDLLATYNRFYYSDSNPDFDLQWETLAAENQILSENASYQHWNNILQKLDAIFYKHFAGPRLLDASRARIEDARLETIFKEEAAHYRLEHPGDDLSERQFIESFDNRYVAGIIILHGTDTLAYTAAALNFTIQDLPCPVILTGANQPPDKEPLVEGEPEFWESDTWKNLATSLYFLQCVGHRYTEVFVCFADTVNHGPNLRKTPLEMFPVRRAAVRRQRVEPFSFRNYSLRRQYVFRCIEGVFCNNFYPLYLKKQGPGADGGFHDLWLRRIRNINSKVKHFRENPFEGSSREPPRLDRFEPGVVAVKIHPLFPRISVRGWGSRRRGGGAVRTVVVEGYKSGTYPTRKGSPFAEFLLGLYKEGIPVVLVARYGIHPTSNPYKTEEVAGIRIPVLPLFGVIMETALPLVAFVVGKISKEDWWGLGEGAEATAGRVELVKKTIRSFLLGRENIVTLDLGDITDQSALRGRSEELIKDELHNDHSRRQANMDPVARVRFEPPNAPQAKDWSSGRAEAFLGTELLRGDFLWFLGELIRPLEKAGAAPDGFAVLTDMGFDWGYYGVEGYYKDKGWLADGVTFPKRTDKQRATLIEGSNEIIEAVRRTLAERGMSQVEHGETRGITTQLGRGGHQGEVDKFWFEVMVRKGADKPQHEERYRVQHYADREAEFFRVLSRGVSREPRTELAEIYAELEEKSWRQPLNDVDWFVLGAFKGATSAIASYLQFDELCSGLPGLQEKKARIRAIRESIRLEVLPQGMTSFRLRATYYAHQGRHRIQVPGGPEIR
jgi:hypothetical protein